MIFISSYVPALKGATTRYIYVNRRFGLLATARSLFGFGFLRRSITYIPIGVQTRLYRSHPCERPGVA
jgi:hypothetical protein